MFLKKAISPRNVLIVASPQIFRLYTLHHHRSPVEYRINSINFMFQLLLYALYVARTREIKSITTFQERDACEYFDLMILAEKGASALYYKYIPIYMSGECANSLLYFIDERRLLWWRDINANGALKIWNFC